MKKTVLTITALLISLGYGVLSWNIITYSEVPGPEDSAFAGICSVITNPDNTVSQTTYDMCCIDYNEALDAARRDWQTTLRTIADQEKPASEMVKDAYESLRTYNCWMEYICGAVQYSGYAPVESAFGTGLKEAHLGRVPGCQSPDNLRMEREYNQLMLSMREIPIAGVLSVDITENKINYFPRCMTDPNNNRNPNILQAQLNYEGCKRALELHFGCPDWIDEVFCPEFSNAFVTLESTLKKSHADQKASALERKLADIVGKMSGMQEHVAYLSNFLTQLENRFACYAPKCD